MSDDWRDDVAGAIADREAVDWTALVATSRASADPALVDELRVLEQVARVHSRPIDVAARIAEPPLDLLPCQWGPLTVLDHIGRGTFGDVYRAHDSRLDRTVALKILRSPTSTQDTVVAEARLMARVHHPNVVAVYGAERIHGQVGVWMSLVDGRTLEDELVAAGAFDPEAVVAIGLDVCAALQAVHRAGIVHRDVKTENILRAADGRIVLADFGAGSDGAEAGAAADHQLAGTPLYLAPEVLAKHPASPQSDIYSLGVVLFHLLTGSFPLVGRTIDDLRRAHAAGERRRLRRVRPDTPARLARVVDRCLAPNPAVRLQDAGAVAQALRGARGRTWMARRVWAMAAVFLTVVAASLALSRYGSTPMASPDPVTTSAEMLALRRVLDHGATSVSQDGRYVVRNAFVVDLSSGDQRRWRPLDERHGSIVAPRISRDGTLVAYEWCTAFQRCELRVSPLDAERAYASGRAVRPLDPDIRLSAADWSPDGQSILVERSHTDGTRELGIVTLHDGSFRTLTPIDWRDSTAFFSPDGRTVAFDVPASDAEWQRDIFVMAVDGGPRIPAVVGPANDVLMGWSPDGTHLLFASDRSGTMDLWTGPLPSDRPYGNPERVKTGIGNVRSLGVTTTGALFFRTPANEVDIEIAAIDVRSGTRLAAPFRPPQSVPGTNLEPAWSPDGQRLAYVSRRDGDDLAGTIVISSVATHEYRELPPLKLTYAQGLSWAPDGRSLAMTGLDLKGRSGLYRVDADTGDVSPLASAIPPTFQGPFWLPDGARLYFQSVDRAIHEWDIAVGRQRTIRPAPTADAWRNMGSMSVSPDGRWIASYDRPADLLQAVVISAVDGGESREVFRLSSGELDVMPIPWTPASDAVIVRTYAEPLNRATRGGELWLIPLDGGPPRKLNIDLATAVSGQLGKIRLSPDGRQVAYVAGKSYQTETWVLQNFLPTGVDARK